MINIPGFVQVPESSSPYLKLCTEGFHRCSKTHFALATTPAPILVVATDANTAHIATKIKAIRKCEMIINTDFVFKNPFMSQAQCSELWERFKRLYFDTILKAPVKTIVIDTASDLWELTRMSEFGRLEKVPQFAYGLANNPWRQMVNACTDKNLIMTHKLASYGPSKVGRKGMEEVAYLSHAVIRHFRAGPEYTEPEQISNLVLDSEPGSGQFGLKIMDSSHDPSLAGTILFGDEYCSFVDLATTVFPKTKPRDWE